MLRAQNERGNFRSNQTVLITQATRIRDLYVRRTFVCKYNRRAMCCRLKDHDRTHGQIRTNANTDINDKLTANFAT